MRFGCCERQCRDDPAQQRGNLLPLHRGHHRSERCQRRAATAASRPDIGSPQNSKARGELDGRPGASHWGGRCVRRWQRIKQLEKCAPSARYGDSPDAHRNQGPFLPASLMPSRRCRRELRLRTDLDNNLPIADLVCPLGRPTRANWLRVLLAAAARAAAAACAFLPYRFSRNPRSHLRVEVWDGASR